MPKRLLPLYLIVLVVSFRAALLMGDANGSPYEQNRMDTLHYRVPQSHVVGDLSLSTRLRDAETAASAGATTATYTRTSLGTSLGLSYGFTDDFLVAIDGGYLFKESTTRTAQPAQTVTTTDASGLSNPSFHANFRYLGGLRGTQFGSVFLDVVPKIGNRKIADSGQSGNDLPGQTLVDLGTAFAWVSGIHELSAEATAIYRTSSVADASDPKNSNTTDAYLTFGFGATYRFHFLDDFSLSASASLLPGHDIIYTYGNRTPVLVETASYPVVRVFPSLAVGWRAAPNCAFYARYSHEAYTRTVARNVGTAFSSAYAVDLLSLGGRVEF